MKIYRMFSFALLTFFPQLVKNKVDDFPILSRFKSDVVSFYNPHDHVHLVCDWRLVEPVSTNPSSSCFAGTRAISRQIIPCSLDSIKNTKQLTCFNKRKTYSDFLTLASVFTPNFFQVLSLPASAV